MSKSVRRKTALAALGGSGLAMWSGWPVGPDRSSFAAEGPSEQRAPKRSAAACCGGPKKQCLQFLLLLFLLASLGACKSGERLTKKTEERTKKELLNHLKAQYMDFEWLAAKGKGKLKTEEENLSFSLKMRMRRDSLIWMTFKKVSVEGLRLQISKDRLETLNRQANEYRAVPYGKLEEQLGVSLSLRELQDLLLGNPILLERLDFKLKQDSQYYHLTSPLPKDGQLELWLDADYRIRKSRIERSETEFMTVTFEDYQELNGKYLAFTKILEAQNAAGKSVYLKIDLNKIELNEPQRMRFKVPDHYEQWINGYKQ